MCQTYITCDGNPDSCQLEVYQTSLEDCAVDDLLCQDGTLLMSAAIRAYDNEDIWTTLEAPDIVIQTVPAALTAFWQGNDAEALHLYASITPDDHPTDIMIPLSRAILYTRMNQPEAALNELDYALALAPFQPLALYARSELYAALGRDDEAAIDIAVLASYLSDESEFSEWVSELQAAHPFDEPVMEDWLMYPVSSTSFGVGGEYTTDESAASPKLVKVAYFPYLDRFVTVGINHVDKDNNPETTDQTKIVLDGHGTGQFYDFNYPEYGDSSGSIFLRARGDYLEGYDGVSYFEGSGSWKFLLAPVDEPDPRLKLEETRYCMGSVLSRFVIGDIVGSIQELSPEYPLNLYNIPEGTVLDSIPNSPSTAIIGGPLCQNNVTWWEAYNAGINKAGWIAENQDNLYIAHSFDIDPEDLNCGGLQSRLNQYENATVVPGLGANNLRAFPGEGGIIGSIPAEASVTIVGNAICVNNMIWWYVDYNSELGWTAEGQDSTYWLQPE